MRRISSPVFETLCTQGGNTVKVAGSDKGQMLPSDCAKICEADTTCLGTSMRKFRACWGHVAAFLRCKIDCREEKRQADERQTKAASYC
jgi:hypothetical protein